MKNATTISIALFGGYLITSGVASRIEATIDEAPPHVIDATLDNIRNHNHAKQLFRAIQRDGIVTLAECRMVNAARIAEDKERRQTLIVRNDR